MIYDVFSVFDEKAGAFLPPFMLPNEAMAKRVFGDCINSDSHQFGAHPSDYTLFRLGQFDDSAGQYLLERTKHPIGNGVEFLEVNPTPEKINGKAQAFGDEPPVLTGPSSEDSS